jgi:hypothetical protein
MRREEGRGDRGGEERDRGDAQGHDDDPITRPQADSGTTSP